MFQIRQRGTTVRREVLGGITTFMAMSYILFVQPAVLSKAGMDPGGIFMATCVASALACVVMGLLANYPIALAPGMGENFFFVYTLCGVGVAAGAFRLNWQEALALTTVTGTLFLLLSLVGFRSRLLDAIPDALKSGIAAGIGLFIALIGFEWGNLLEAHPATFVTLAKMPGNYEAGLTVLGLAVTLALAAFHVRGAILLGILITTACAWGLGRVGIRSDLGLAVEPGPAGAVVARVEPKGLADRAGLVRAGDTIVRFHGRPIRSQQDLLDACAAAREERFADVELLRPGPKTVRQPLRIETIEYEGLLGRPSGLGKTAGKFVGGYGSLWGKLLSRDWVQVVAFAFILLFMDIFDTVGTLVGVAKRAGLMTEAGQLPRAERALAADAAGTVIGGCLGTSEVTSYIESIAGVAAGARTGLSAVVAGACLVAALVFQPVVRMVGAGIAIATDPFGDPVLRYPMIAPALIVVGAMMMRAIRDIDWDDLTEALPGFLAMVAMPFAYSISAGIAFGFVAYAFGKLVTGRARECPILVYVFAVLFVVQYAFVMHRG